MQFKDKLRELRIQSGLTQEQLAQKANMPLSSLRGHEQGQRVPSWASVVKLSRALEVQTDAFSDCDEVRPTRAKPFGATAMKAKRAGKRKG